MKYFLNRLTQISLWFGVCVILCAIFATRGEIIALGVVMLFLNDETIKGFIAKRAPGLARWLESFMADL